VARLSVQSFAERRLHLGEPRLGMRYGLGPGTLIARDAAHHSR
jgi:hypothetical protein